VSGENNVHIQQILKAKPYTNKVKLLSDLCRDYRLKSTDSATIFGNQALQLTRELNLQQRYSSGL